MVRHGIRESATLLPIVRWAQQKGALFLKVELQECQVTDISLKSDSINFQATGIGAKGRNPYGFHLTFFKPVIVENLIHKVTGSSVEISLLKDGLGEWWPRLTLQVKTPHFLKLDFDKWKSESDDEGDGMGNLEDKFFRNFEKERKCFQERKEMFWRAYLVIYNMVQFLVHVYIFSFCVINLIRAGPGIFPYTYDRCGNAVHLAVILSMLEAVHPLAGIIRGDWTIPLLQSVGRNFALFCLWLASDDIKNEWYVTILFLAWSSIELFRYPLYICNSLNLTSRALTWVRYTVWIPLYPLGTLTEAILYIRASQTFNYRGSYELSTPNPFNVAIKFTWMIQIYVATLFFIVAAVMMPHMWNMRQKRLGCRRKYKQP